MTDLNVVRKAYLRVERVKLLRDLSLLDDKEETIYDGFTQLASNITGTPISLVTMVAANYQFFKSMVGLPDPWASRRKTPLSHSFCQHVVTSGEPLIITDARELDFLKENQAIPDLNVIGYLGIPVNLFDNRTLGSFCVIDSEPREWTQLDIGIITEIAAVISYEFDRRALARMDSVYQSELDDLHTAIHEFLTEYETQSPLSQAHFLTRIRDWRKEYKI
ncbi:MAG: GAF domain-containing protein [Aggregatilineales bacterium]